MNVTDGASEETIVVAPYWPGEGYGGGTKVASMEEAIAEAKHLAKQGYGKGKSIIHIVRTTRTVIEWNSDHSDLAALPRPEADEGAVAAADLGQHEREGLRWIATHGNPYRSGDPARPWWTTLVELKRLGLVDADNNLTDAGRAALAAAQEGS